MGTTFVGTPAGRANRPIELALSVSNVHGTILVKMNLVRWERSGDGRQVMMGLFQWSRWLV